MCDETTKTEFMKRYNACPLSTELNIQEYEKICLVGKGAFSDVVLFRQVKTNEYVVAKRALKSFIVKKNLLRQIVHEKRIMFAAENPFILKLLFSCTDNDATYIFLPFITGGDLYRLLKSQGKLSEPCTRFLSGQVILAIEYLHKLNIIHRDIKPDNVLIDSLGYIKLTDMGISKMLDGPMWSFCGTPEYIAPEIIHSKGYGKAVDWWAVGILIYEMTDGRTPFHISPNNEMLLYKKISTGDYIMPNAFSIELQDLLRKLLHTDASRRIGSSRHDSEELRSHKWFRNLNWEDLYKHKIPAPIRPRGKNETDISKTPRCLRDNYTHSAICKYSLEFAEF